MNRLARFAPILASLLLACSGSPGTTSAQDGPPAVGGANDAGAADAAPTPGADAAVGPGGDDAGSPGPGADAGGAGDAAELADGGGDEDAADAAPAFVWYCYANSTSLTAPAGQFCNSTGLVTVSCGAAPATTAPTCPTTDVDPCPMVNNAGSGSACSVLFSNGNFQPGFVGYPCIKGACPMGGVTTQYGPTHACVCND